LTDQPAPITTSTLPPTAEDVKLVELLRSSHLDLAALLELQRKTVGSHPQTPAIYQALA